jgi:UDP-2,3-diacylglucosamine hydrolase
MTTLFVSDLHLHAARPEITALFLDFLRGEAAHAEALYILGDLFEVWLGDDADDEVAVSVRAALGKLSGSGVAVSLMRGNRDFLFGPRIAAEAGVRLLADPCVVSLYGEPTLLMHGDLLCSDDRAYLAFRAQVREPSWQAQFLALPLAERAAYASKARAASSERQSGLREQGALETITDANTTTVAETMARYGVRRLIHGHTHRPAIHSLFVDGAPAQRIVLGDWYEQGSVLRASPEGFALTVLEK